MADTMTEKVVKLMDHQDKIRNICTCAHIDHGKTTFSDSLLAGAGMISEELAGKQLALDFHEDEIARGITIDAANVSMVHEINNVEHLINLIDTPGHVDFGGDVTRAMRAVDGAIVLVDSVEGMMPQTETVLRQALRERVKPVLFINKVDRLIKEVKLTPDKMQEKFVSIINSVNRFMESVAPEEFKQKWKVSVQEGSVAFGSAFHKWAVSFTYMQKAGVTFKDIYDAYQNDTYKDLAKKVPLHKVVLDMVVKHHPNPKEAQKYRVPKIWHGDLESPLGKSLTSCDPEGPVAFVVTKIVIDKHAGEIAAGRLFSGTVRQGQEVYMNMGKRSVRLQQINLYKGAQRISIEQAKAGNIIGLVGLKDTYAGENLISGMGELHLEVRENRIRTEKGLEIKTGSPIVVYRESIRKQTSEVIEGKSPNKHNKFKLIVEKIPEDMYAAMKSGELPEIRIKKKDQNIIDKLRELGVESKESIKYKEFYKGNILVDATKGIVHIGEVIELIADGFEQVMSEGPLAREPGFGLRVKITDCKLHEDAIHRGPAQVLPAIRDGIKEAMVNAGAVLFEPLQITQIESPAEFLGEISKLVQNKRGQLIDVVQEGEHITVKAKLPVAEMFGLTSELRSSTNGRGSHYIVDQVFEKIPDELQQRVKQQIRKRKGLREDALIV